MCGIAGAVGAGWSREQLVNMLTAQHHRGPDAQGIYTDAHGPVGLVHNRLSIIDLSKAGRQPMSDASGSLHLVFNGEIYNYLELKRELVGYEFRTATDTEVILAAYQRWGEACLDKFIGMFAFLLWDSASRKLFAARDRFGVKPLHYHRMTGGGLLLASEVRALHAAGVPASPDATSWATYFVYGLHDHDERTFWESIEALPPGHKLVWENGQTRISRWYDLADRVGADYDTRPIEEVEEECRALLVDSVKLRFRSDVPVGINISGGLDSSLLLGLVQAVEGPGSAVKAFTYISGDERYDELPWVNRMLEQTKHSSIVHCLRPNEVPELALSVQAHESAPFGGLPTLAYARLFELARRDGVIVLLDGQGVDEQWAGYEYYGHLADSGKVLGPVQASVQRPVRPECLVPNFCSLAEPLEAPKPFPDALRNRQYLDARYTKIPRALRFNDRVSMRASTELREPFLDHRLFELAFRQPGDRKIREGQQKYMIRRITRTILPSEVVEAPKRPVQTPQREWLSGPLRQWSTDCIEMALAEFGGDWLKVAPVRAAWREYCQGGSDNSFYVWQWISLGLMLQHELMETKQ